MKLFVMFLEIKKVDFYKLFEVFKKFDERVIEVNNNSFFIYDWYMYNIDKIIYVYINYIILIIIVD